MNHAQPPLHVKEGPAGFTINTHQGVIATVYELNNANLFALAPIMAASGRVLLNQLQGMKVNIGAGVSMPMEDICKEPMLELQHALNLLDRKPNQVVMS